MSGEPVVSVVMANYQAAPFVAAALRSVLASSLAALEVIVVDDASRDDGPAIARAVAADDPRVRVEVLPANAGPAAARNRGFALARGRWIAIVDSDDLVEPDRFARLAAAADAAGVAMVADDMLVFDDPATDGPGTDGPDIDGLDLDDPDAEGPSPEPPRRFLKPADRTAPFRLDLGEFLRRSVLYGPEPAPGFLKPLIRRDAWAASGVTYDESLRIAEDEHLVARLLLAGLDYLVVPEPGYRYRKHGGSISHRLTVPAVAAMQGADRALAAEVLARRPDLAPVCTARARALTRVLAFERMLAALKTRDLGTAIKLAATNPAALPLFRMPLASLVDKVRRRLGG